MTEAPATRARRSTWVLLAFAAPWLVYFALLARQPDDRFAAWHNDVAWPAEHFLTVQFGGLVMPVFGYAMFAGIGGLLVAGLVGWLVGLVCRLVRVRDVGGAVIVPVWIAACLWCFAVIKAVPQTVTVIDPEARALRVHEFDRWTRWPAGTVEIRGDEVIALDLTSFLHRRSEGRYLEMFVMTRDRTVVKLAERACDSSEVEACLASGDADLVELARWLGRSPGAPDPALRPGHHLLVLDRT